MCATPLRSSFQRIFQWNPETDAAYERLLHAVLHGKFLKSFEIGAPSTSTVDASDYALGAALEQRDQPVIFITRKLSRAKRGYSQTQKEALAVVWAEKNYTNIFTDLDLPL